MDRKLGYILAVSLLVAIAAVAYNVYYLYPRLKDIVVATSVKEAVEAAAHLREIAFSENRPAINPEAREHLKTAREQFNLYRIKVYSAGGEVVFSTRPEDEGTFNTGDYFEEKIKRGEVITKVLSRRETTMEGQKVNTDVVETYVPVMEGDRFIGAFEIYFDISENFSRLGSIIRDSSLVVSAAMAAFFAIIAILTIKVNNTLGMLRRAEESADRACKAKGEFLARMSHEIRTPMNAIIGLSDILSHDHLTVKQREEVGMLRFSADHLLTIINDMLDVSKIEAGKMELASAAFSLRGMLDLLVRSISVISAEKGLALDMEISPEVPEAVAGDRVRLTQVLNNLLMNAIKFTDEGSVRLLVEPGETGPERTCIRFSVMDTGVGISEEYRRYIFDPFTQEDGGTTRRFGGTGLGLTITDRLVRMMGGTLEVRSHKGAGSTFSFSACFGLPAEGAAPLGIAPREDRDGALLPTGEMRPFRILLAEDNQINQKVAIRILEKAGHTVEAADNGQDAVTLSRAGRCDLILMDIEMPVMDGYEAVRQIREMEGEAGRIPIIAMTAHAFERDCNRCLQNGMDDYIAKPINAWSLIDKINRTMQRLEGG